MHGNAVKSQTSIWMEIIAVELCRQTNTFASFEAILQIILNLADLDALSLADTTERKLVHLVHHLKYCILLVVKRRQFVIERLTLCKLNNLRR